MPFPVAPKKADAKGSAKTETATEPKAKSSGALSLDAPLMPPPPKVHIKPGYGYFTVDGMEIEERECGKLGHCNVLKLKLSVRNVDGEETALYDDLIYHSNMMWKLLAFFTSIGQRKHGDNTPFVPKLDKVIGANGFCTIVDRTWLRKKDNVEVTDNNIGTYLDQAEFNEQTENAYADEIPF